ncbi:RNA binding Lupus La [Schistosoma japonicum]|uniref:RNA binding Lupus La n=2 Tax=Schistosoma japonicum TaxID=6182 RepID=A0A4Z2D8M4_SCHJA|nr:RNA binding Lupus La [Schistosoma japonicum]
MSESFSSKFSQLSVRPEKGSHNDSSNNQRASGDEDKGSKGNPWKPIVPSSENNSLEADAWPEPSAPAEQRRITRVAEEKPKSKTDTSRHAFTGKLKWHNYEVDDATCGFPRGRGRLSVGAFAGANYTSGNVRSFRRGKKSVLYNVLGYGGYRSRILTDANRGRGSNGFYRQSGRSANTRPVNEPKENMSESNRNKSPVQVAVDASSAPVDIQLGTDVSSHDEKVQEPSSSPSELVEVSGKAETDLQNKLNTVPTVSGPTPRKNYRERSNVSSQSGGQPANIPPNYDAGPVGRARRSYQRQHPPMYSAETDNHNLNSHSTLVGNSPIQPLIPFQTLPQIAYIIPGAPAAMLGPALQLTQAPASHTLIPTNVSLPNTQILSTQPTIQHPIAALSHLPVENLPLPLLPDASAVQPVHHSFNPQSSMTSGMEQPADTIEVVDVTQVITYINEVGWKKVIFPTSLREHRSVAAAIKDTLGSSNHDLADLTESAVNKNDLSNLSPTQSRSDDATARPVKADDVIIVEDRVFFVPRNVNRTKFLKFLSKLDYIKHHVEYYFSESNLQRDSHLFTILAANQDVCPLSELLQFHRLRWVSTTESELLDAISSSSVLLVVYSPDGSPAGITRACPTLTRHRNEGCSPPIEIGYARPANQGVSLTTSASDQNPIIVQVSTASNQSFTHPSVDPLNQNMSVLSPAPAHSFGSGQVSTNSNNSPFPVTTQILGVSGQSLSSIQHNSLPNYIQSSAHVLAPNNFGILTNASPGNIYSSSSSSQQQATVTTPFYQPDLGPQSAIRPAQAFHCPQIYTQHQAAALVAAAANQCGLLASGPNTSVLPPSDPNTASFISALYRLTAPGTAAPIVGTYVPSIGNPNNIPTGAPNSAVFLQFIPGPHPGQTNAYFAPPISCPPGTNSLLARSVPAHAGGMWIPLNHGSGANGGIVSTHPYQPYVALTQAHPSLSLSNNPSGNGGLYSVTSSHSFPTAFGTLPTFAIGPDVSGFGAQKVFSHGHSLSSPHAFTNHQSPVTSSANAATISTQTGHASQINVNHSSVPGSQQSNSNVILGKRMPTNTQT